LTINVAQNSASGAGTSGETFQAHPFTGAAAYSIPIFTSSCRDAEPHLSLGYSSHSGNGSFGLGFALATGAITRQTSKARPRYNDDDILVIDGADELVPMLQDKKGKGKWLPVPAREIVENNITYKINYFRTKTEGKFARIERWRNSTDTHWRVRGLNNHVSIYGMSKDARISAPPPSKNITTETAKISRLPEGDFSWLLEEIRDPNGHRTNFVYIPDRSKTEASVSHTGVNRHIGTVRYGAYTDSNSTQRWNFEIHFDYSGMTDDEILTDIQSDTRPAPVIRGDILTNHKPGFTLVTSVLCRKIMMLHRFGDSSIEIVRSQTINYGNELPSQISHVSTRCYRQDSPAKDTPTIQLKYVEKDLKKAPKFVRLTDTKGDPFRQKIHAFADLDEVGVPAILTLQGSQILASRSSGKGVFEPSELMAHHPLADEDHIRFDLADLGGDGRHSLVQTSGGLSGYHRRRADGSWAVFKVFDGYPLNSSGAGLNQVDVSGDGLPDRIEFGPCGVTVWPSLGYDGFGRSYLTPPICPDKKSWSKDRF